MTSTTTSVSQNFCDSMLVIAFRRYCIKPQWTQRGQCSASKTTTAVSLSQAARNADTVETLNLEDSPDLLCVNLMCEKVGDPCICRLSRVLEKLHHLEGLNLSGNKLISLPESIGQLERLRHLDLSNNNLQTLPNTMQQLKELQVNLVPTVSPQPLLLCHALKLVHAVCRCSTSKEILNLSVSPSFTICIA